MSKSNKLTDCVSNENPPVNMFCYIQHMKQHVKPFIKWVGGKTQLLDEIRKYYPAQIEKYCEPFVGGGAVLFDILSKAEPKEVLINDINAELINTYRQIKENCSGIIDKLASLQEKYWNSSLDENKNLYLKKENVLIH